MDDTNDAWTAQREKDIILMSFEVRFSAVTKAFVILVVKFISVISLHILSGPYDRIIETTVSETRPELHGLPLPGLTDRVVVHR